MTRAFSPVSEDRWYRNAICQGPHRDGQWPCAPTPTSEEIREDLLTMLPHWRLARLYGSSDFGDILIEHIRRIRAAVTVPVTTADDDQYWLEPSKPPSTALRGRGSQQRG